MRERFVTRTVKGLNCECAVLSADSMSVNRQTFAISATIPEEKRLNAIRTTYHVEAVKILAVTETETLYGMPEADFIRLAKILPPRSGANEEGEEG